MSASASSWPTRPTPYPRRKRPSMCAWSPRTADPATDVDALIRRAQAISTVSNSLSRGLPVRVDILR
jgi:hypothetical protein